MLGPFSAHAQQQVMEKAGALPTKHNLLLSLRVYSYAAFYNTYTIPAILAIMGFGIFLFDRSKSLSTKLGVTAIWSPVLFNILALYFGFSVLYVQGISGNTWFNVRYGIMVMPAIAICVAYLFDKAKQFRLLLVGILLFVLFFAFMNQDAVTIDDARVGSSQKNVSQVSDYLRTHAKNTPGFILISAASHDAIIFSSGLPMKRFIHEGTGEYWKDALRGPEHWARWIVMRSYDENDLVWRSVSRTSGFHSYTKVASYPFADVYELQATASGLLHLSPVPGKNVER